MIILFLSGDSVDFATDLLFNGLAELCSQDNIIDYPFREWHHVKKITGYLANSQSMHPPYVYWCSTLDKEYNNRQRYSFDEIKQLINQDYFDVVIVSNRALDTYIQLKEGTIKFPITIIINGEDYPDKYYNIIVDKLSKYWDTVSLFLQREYRYDNNYDNKVVPYTFSCPVTNLPNFDFKKDTQIDVFCRHGPSHPFRQKVLDRIKKIKGINIDAGYAELQIQSYFERMNNSKISISIGGAGWDTPHYIEPPYIKSLLLAQPPKNAIDHDFNSTPVIYPNNFTDRSSAVFYKNDLTDIEELIRYYIENEKEREDITKRGYEHLKNNLTTKRMAKYVLKNLEDNNYWRSLTL